MTDLTPLAATAGHLARPAGPAPWPAQIVIHEWHGLDDQTRRIADRFAGDGYLSFAPDLFHGEQAPPGDSAAAMRLVGKYSPSAIADLAGVGDALRTHPDATGKLGAVGFCYGGRMALALALSRPVDAVCTFYGGGMQQLFEQLERIKCPVLGLFGDHDASIPIGTIEEFDRLLDQAGVEHEVKVYPGAGHGFFRDSDLTAYRPEAAQDAWQKATGFFSQHLKA
jgi:carboxymethylenebutenolidase